MARDGGAGDGQGICPRCSASVERSVGVCDDHDPSEDSVTGAIGVSATDWDEFALRVDEDPSVVDPTRRRTSGQR